MSAGQGAAPQVLVTRPEPGASATAARLQAMGFAPVLAPALEIIPLAANLPAPGSVQAVLVTSANALPALHGFRSRMLLTVGDATARAAREAGHVRVESASGDAAALATLVAQRCDPGNGPLLLATAEAQGTALASSLAGMGFRVESRAVYAQRRPAALPAPACQALRGGTVAAALFFSAETARGFVALVQEAGLAGHTAGAAACAIADPVAAALAPLPWRSIRVALQPNQNELLALLR